jgi:hypothetical protein
MYICSNMSEKINLKAFIFKNKDEEAWTSIIDGYNIVSFGETYEQAFEELFSSLVEIFLEDKSKNLDFQNRKDKDFAAANFIDQTYWFAEIIINTACSKIEKKSELREAA